MRITTIILFAAIMQVSASSFAQSVTLIQKNITLDEFFREIRKQTGYNVSYSDKVIDDAKRLNVNFQSTPLEQALTIALQDQKLSFEISDKDITILKKTPSFLERLADRWAAIDVHGRVVDQEGKPLPGATVKVKGTGKSVSTNGKGEFYLGKVEGDAVLVVSFVGYVSKEVNIGEDIGDVVLDQSDSKLDEVQVMAYGTTTRRLSTGNVSSVTAQEIEKNITTNPLIALQGKIPGVVVESTQGISGSVVNVRIRGNNRLATGAPPLYIVDGVPYSDRFSGLNINQLRDMSPFSFLNPNDIESISVLKDADATSIYGSRGSNGVLLITTKKGKAGEAKFEFGVTSEFGRLSETIPLMNTQQYLEMRREAYKNDGLPIPDVTTNPDFLNYDLTLYDQNKYTDWQKELFGAIAVTNRYSGSVSGGTGLTQYLIRGEYYRESDVTIGDQSNNRANVQLSLSNNSINERFKSTLSVIYNTTAIRRVDLSYNTTRLAPNAPNMRDQNGQINWAENSQGVPTWSNPLVSIIDPYDAKVINMQASSNLSYELSKSLNVKVNLGVNELRGDNFKGSSIEATSPVNRPNFIAAGTKSESNTINYNFEPQLSYQFGLGKSRFDLLSGISYQYSKSNAISIFASGMLNEQLSKNFGAATSYFVGNTESQYKFLGFLNRINFNHNDKYIANAVFRRDGSSRFGPGNQYGNFGSLGIGWIFSKEKFISSKFPVLSFGKIRASYGLAGNSPNDDYQYLGLFEVIGSEIPYQGLRGYRPQGLSNPYFKWETTKKAEIGLDLGILADRIIFSSSFYRDRSSDQLVVPLIPSISGPTSNSFLENFPAVIENKGIELQLTYFAGSTGQLKWSSSVNFSLNRDKLLSYPGLETSSRALDLVIGQPFFRSRKYDFTGVNPFTGVPEYLSATGENVTAPWNIADRLTTTSLQPRYLAGLSTDFTYRDFNLSLVLQYVEQNGSEFYYDFPPGMGWGTANLPVASLNRWQKPGDDAKLPKYTSSFLGLQSYYRLRNESDAFVTNASYLKLRNISLSYRFPKHILSKMKLLDMSLFLRGQNVFTITKFKSGDPEVNKSSVDNYPTLRVFAIGLNLNL